MPLKTRTRDAPIQLTLDTEELVEVALRENSEGQQELIATWRVPEDDGGTRLKSERFEPGADLTQAIAKMLTRAVTVRETKAQEAREARDSETTEPETTEETT